MLGFQSVLPIFQDSDVFDGFTKDVGFAALACDLDTVHKPSFVNHIDDGAVLAVRDTDPRACHKNNTFDVLLNLLAVPTLFVF